MTLSAVPAASENLAACTGGAGWGAGGQGDGGVACSWSFCIISRAPSRLAAAPYVSAWVQQVQSTTDSSDTSGPSLFPKAE
eukprot:2820216-Rhodomonas_salina.2